MIQIFYFASLREHLNCASDQLMLPPAVEDLTTLTHYLAQRGGAWQQAFAGERSLLMAVNQVMAKPNAPLRDGDEVAFFPPVTGG